MGFEIALNFMVKNSKGELVRSVLCHTKLPKMPINTKGLKYVPELKNDIYSLRRVQFFSQNYKIGLKTDYFYS